MFSTSMAPAAQRPYSPWLGLSRLATRLDLWSLILELGGPDAAARAAPAAWVAAGLPLDQAGILAAGGPDPGGRVLTAADPSWPRALSGQPFAPVLLGAEGNLDLLARPAVAVVGARACTSYGLEQAAAIASGVAAAGGVVVSGLARGIDRQAHLAAPGATIAVLGQGLECPLPAWQAALRARIVRDGGLVVSEFPAALSADVWTFPVRNRVVAGLARVVVVVEAGHRSGAKNTAWHGWRLGRDVLAVPGPVHAPASAGCLDLIEEGAGMVRDVGTVLRASGLVEPQACPDPGPHGALLQALGSGGDVERVMRATGLDHAAATAGLVELCLSGRVRRLPGNRFQPCAARPAGGRE